MRNRVNTMKKHRILLLCILSVVIPQTVFFLVINPFAPFPWWVVLGLRGAIAFVTGLIAGVVAVAIEKRWPHA